MVRTIKRHPTLFSLVLILMALPVFVKSTWLTVTANAAFDRPSGFATIVKRAGLGPVELAAAGVSDTDAAGVVLDVLAEWNADPDALPDAQTAYVAAKVEKQRLQRLIRSGRASAQDVTDYGEAVADFNSAEAARQAVLDALFAAGVADLGAGQVDCLATIRGNSEQTADVEFRVVDRTEGEWLALDAALANQQIAARYGETAAAECVSHLATLRADADVAAARTACDTNLAAVRTAWNSATEG